ncbi:trypsin-1-like isoform X2 [Zootermopsis nevadensis]|uniref:trypsin-1-like isoform X2 n=1 Tax=Zootermopsis nevadensis TaxID=136037 RepID=UPI000B8E787E|nr:trypsin-1-like isoform X2 [Zootermopsis nevadensis]
MVTYIWKSTVVLLLIVTFVDYAQLQPTGEDSVDRMSTIFSFFEWILSIISPSSEDSEDVQPEPIDPSKCEPCKCGLANKKIRIVGGHETQVNQYPWMAQLLYNNRFYCGGTLINSKYILTASHCVKGFNRKNIVVRLLEHARGISNETETIDRRVQRVVIHSRYDYTTFNNDIALLSLDRDVALEDRLRPACLPALGRSFTGMQGVVIGWGTTEQYGGSSDVLNEVKVPIMSNKECRMTPYGNKAITENMMCAGFPEGKKDACQGDSGGPLHVTNGTLYSVAGVVSWGEGCALPNHPGVYTRVNRYISWIKRNTIDSCFCE